MVLFKDLTKMETSFWVDLRGDSENQCGELVVGGLNRVFAMIFAIEQINNDSFY